MPCSWPNSCTASSRASSFRTTTKKIWPAISDFFSASSIIMSPSPLQKWCSVFRVGCCFQAHRVHTGFTTYSQLKLLCFHVHHFSLSLHDNTKLCLFFLLSCLVRSFLNVWFFLIFCCRFCNTFKDTSRKLIELYIFIKQS